MSKDEKIFFPGSFYLIPENIQKIIKKHLVNGRFYEAKQIYDDFLYFHLKESSDYQ